MEMHSGGAEGNWALAALPLSSSIYKYVFKY